MFEDSRRKGRRAPRLIILDDEPLTGETIQRMAEFSGFEALHTTQADEFLNLLGAWPPDVVALDLIMPGMDGVEVIRELADRGCSARLIITSGVGSRVLDAADRSARAHGLDIAGVLPKPFSPATLRAMLDKALERFPGHTEADAAGQHPPRRQLTLDDLSTAIAQHHITLAFQPKVRCRTGTLVGFEALARWQHPELGRISPDTFILLAENHGLIDELTRQITDQALSWLAELSSDETARHLGGFTLQESLLSLNISAASMGNQELFDGIVQRCQQLGISPRRVVLELTESSAMQDPTTALDNLTRLRLQGFQLSIDDFGTGYSSMVQLVRLPFSEIKVDKSFVITAGSSEESGAIVRSVVDLGHSLGLNTTAEGVEDESTMDFLKALNCDYAQGYWISPPLLPDAVIPWFMAREEQRESRRLHALQALDLLDTPAEPRFDRITRLASRLFCVPTALITLMDHDRQWFKSRKGLEITQTPRDIAFCNTAINNDDVFVVPDARIDPRFRDNPLVTGPPFIRFYAGQPLCLPDGQKVGTLCVIHTEPRMFTAQDRTRLAELARVVEQELTLRHDRMFDAQTGLLNRHAYQQQMRSAMELCRQLQLEATVVSIRLLDLNRVNRTFGRAAGDHLINNLGRLICAQSKVADLAGQRRGTEFTVLLIDPDPQDAEGLCGKLQSAIVQWNNQQLPESVRIDCEIATARFSPSASGSVNQVLRASSTPHSIVLHG